MRNFKWMWVLAVAAVLGLVVTPVSQAFFENKFEEE